ncbi:general amino acid permease agp2 [Elasticomyces elasticus]|nr:general amino acid permease agp2 [Elasticomyces elasticus]
MAGLKASEDYGINEPSRRRSSAQPGKVKDEKHLDDVGEAVAPPPAYEGFEAERRGSVNLSGEVDGTHRKLKPRHIQLIGIGGTIGTALYVQIGRGLLNGGPASLLIAFTLCPFIRFAGRYVDEAFGFAAGWNFFIFEAILVPFEITACNVVIHYWSDVVPAGGIIAIVLVLYALINLLTVSWYGETEFWAALGKVLLIIGLIILYWNNPGSFAPLYYEGNLGRFLGFLQCLIQASFTIAGPDYVSMAAGEAENPRVVMPKAYNAVFYRLTTFFILGALCVGINVPYNDPELTAAFANGEPGAAASPYVVAMNRLRISVLPDIVNALVLASAFSAGNSYVYCASRSLFGMALEGKAPKIFTRTNRQGVPIYCVLAVLAISLLAFLQVSAGSATVLSWFVSLITASQLINFAVMCFTFLAWYKACNVQGLDRSKLPYRAFWQPYAAWYGFVGCTIMAFVGGYTVFLPGQWSASSFVFSYFMIGLCPVLFIGWKLIKKSKWRKPHELDLRGEVEEIDEYTRNFVQAPYRNFADKWFNKAFGA